MIAAALESYQWVPFLSRVTGSPFGFSHWEGLVSWIPQLILQSQNTVFSPRQLRVLPHGMSPPVSLIHLVRSASKDSQWILIQKLWS